MLRSSCWLFCIPRREFALKSYGVKGLKGFETNCEISVESETIFSGEVIPLGASHFFLLHSSSLLWVEERPLALIGMYNNLLRIRYVSKLGWFSLYIKIVSSITFVKSELQKAIVQTASCFKAVCQSNLQIASIQLQCTFLCVSFKWVQNTWAFQVCGIPCHHNNRHLQTSVVSLAAWICLWGGRCPLAMCCHSRHSCIRG